MEPTKTFSATTPSTTPANLSPSTNLASLSALWTPHDMRKVLAWRRAELKGIEAGRDHLKQTLDDMAAAGEVIPADIQGDYLKAAETALLLGHELKLLEEVVNDSSLPRLKTVDLSGEQLTETIEACRRVLADRESELQAYVRTIDRVASMEAQGMETEEERERARWLAEDAQYFMEPTSREIRLLRYDLSILEALEVSQRGASQKDARQGKAKAASKAEEAEEAREAREIRRDHSLQMVLSLAGGAVPELLRSREEAYAYSAKDVLALNASIERHKAAGVPVPEDLQDDFDTNLDCAFHEALEVLIIKEFMERAGIAGKVNQ